MKKTLAFCLFLMVLGSRWALVNGFGTDLPTKDQWDAEGVGILSPWLNHRLTPDNFLQPQNEHRIVLTKLVNFTATLVNGQWDQRVECAVNAVFPGLIAAALFLFGCRGLSRRWHGPLFILLAAAYCLPLGWENTLGGLHSAQFFLIGLSFGAICGLSEAKPGSGAWWGGAICAVLAMGSLATGFFAAAVVIGVLAIRLRRREVISHAAAPAIFICAVLVAIGCLTIVTVDYHDSLAAHGPGDFAASFLHSLEWPYSSGLWPAILLWLPWIWLVRRVLKGAGGVERTFGYTLAGLGGWVILQIAATAYARGAGGPIPSSRYVDTLLFGAVVNGTALCWLWQHGGLPRGGRALLLLLAAGWTLAFGVGAGRETRRVFTSVLPALRVFNYYSEQNTRNYLATGDGAYLRHNEIPYPDPAAYQARLDSADLRPLLPASVRAPLALTAGGESGFIRHDSRSPQGGAVRTGLQASTGLSPATPPLSNSVTWGSYGDRGAGATPTWESGPISSPRGGWLTFEVAGHLGEPGTALELRDAATRGLLDEIRPGKVPGDTWHTAQVRAPGRTFIVVARSSDPRRWFAFSQPVEAGPLSHWLSWVMKYGLAIAGAAALAAALLAWRPISDCSPEFAAPRQDITTFRNQPWPWPPVALCRAAICVLATVAIWLILMDIPGPIGAIDLDASWQETLVHAHLRGWQFGKELIITYGPWGFLNSHYFPPGALAAKFAWEIAGKLGLAAGIVAMSAALPGARRWVFLAATPLLFQFFPDTGVFSFITLCVLTWLVPVETPPWSTGLGLVALAFLAEMKFTNCMLAGAGVATAVACAALRGRWRRGCWLGAGFAAAFLAFWLAAGQNPAHLYDFFRYSFAFSGGYAWCMSLDETQAVFLAGAGAMLLNLAFAVQLWRMRPGGAQTRLSALFLAAAWFLAWKGGFVRADDHVYGFFCFTLLTTLVAPGLFLPGWRGTWIYANVPVCLAGMWLADPGLITVTRAIFWQRVAYASESLSHPKTMRANYDAEERNERGANQLPALRAAVDGGTIDLINFEQGLLLDNDLDYWPRPIFQSYCAFTPRLMAKNLGFYLSPRAPDFLLLRLGSIDWHYPMQEDALVLAALPLRYSVMTESADGALLRRRGAASTAPMFKRRGISEASANFGVDIPLPAERDHALWLRAQFPLSRIGRVRTALYKAPLLGMVITEDDGAQLRFRVVPPMMAEGVVIQPTIETTADYVAFAQGNGLKWARSIRFEPAADEAELWTQAHVQFFLLPELPVARPAPAH